VFNRVKIVESSRSRSTSRSRSLEAEFSNEVAVPFADAFGLFVAGQVMPRQARRRTVEKDGSNVRPDGQLALPEPEDEVENAITVTSTVTDVSISLAEYGGLDKLMAEIDRSAHPEIFSASGARDQSLRLLLVVKQRFGIDGLTAVEIEKLLREKFRIPVTPQGVHSAFDRVGHLVDRVPAEKGSYRYRLMAAGEKYLADPDASPVVAAPRRRPLRRQTEQGGGSGDPSNGTASGKTAHATEKRGRSSSGRPGAKKALTDLAASGFFDPPKLTADAQKHLEEQLGHRFKPNELSPAFLRLVQDGVLKRKRRDADGNYEYSTT
jgi:hypothetical protein